jgi:hypothetical protein
LTLFRRKRVARLINMTPYSIDFYDPKSFTELEQVADGEWVASGLNGVSTVSIPCGGSIEVEPSLNLFPSRNSSGSFLIPLYRDLGIHETPPGLQPDDLVIVSREAKINALKEGHDFTSQMLYPTQVVLSRSTNKLIGYMGLSY